MHIAIWIWIWFWWVRLLNNEIVGGVVAGYFIVAYNRVLINHVAVAIIQHVTDESINRISERLEVGNRGTG